MMARLLHALVAQCAIYNAVATSSQSCPPGAICTSDEADESMLLQHPKNKEEASATLLESNKSEPVSDTSAKNVLAEELSLSKAAAEFVGMTLFVVIGCGSAMSVAKEPGWLLQVSLTFGFAITALAYTIGHHSGGQMNCAVTLALLLTGNITWLQGFANFVAQMCGSVFAACILAAMYPKGQDKTGGMGSNSISDGFSRINAFVGEVMMTFLLVLVVLETAVSPAASANAALAPVAIGFAVFVAHSVLIPIDGCSINPTRSFGPSLIATSLHKTNHFKDHWVFWAGPLTGAILAAGIFNNHFWSDYSI